MTQYILFWREQSLVDFFLNMAIASTIILLFAIVAGHLLRRHSAARRFSIWQTAFLGLLILPPCCLLLPNVDLGWHVPNNTLHDQPSDFAERRFTAARIDNTDLVRRSDLPIANHETGFESGITSNDAQADPAVAPTTTSLISTLTGRIQALDVGLSLLFTWAIVAICLLIRIASSHYRAAMIRRRAVRFALSEKSSIYKSPNPKHDIPILVSADISTPETMGILNPCVLLPPNAGNWPESRLRMVLKHEFAHIERRDVAWQLMAAIAKTACWFQPLAWIAERKMQLDRERACDDHVIRQQETPSDYAMALLEVAADMQDRKIHLTGLLSMAQQPIEKRLVTILESSTRRDPSSIPFRVGIGSLFCCVVLLVSIFQPFGDPSAAAASPAAKTNQNPEQYQGPETATTQDPQLKKEARSPSSQSDDSQKPGPPDDNGKELLERVIAGIKQNYAPIKTAQLTIEYLITGRGVGLDEEKKTQTSHNLFVSIQRSNIVLKGEEFRYDLRTRELNEWNIVETKIRNIDTWTFYQPSQKQAYVRYTKGIGGFFPVDPRDFGGPGQQRPLLVQLKNVNVLKVLSDGSANDRPIVRLLTEDFRGPAQGIKREYSFDSSRNFLPTSVVTLNDDGSVGYAIEIDYEEVIPGKSWFFRDMTLKFFNSDAPNADAENWRQLIVQRIIGKIKINEELTADAFTIDYPDDTQIFDQIRHTIHREGGESK